ncbi:MAG: hypothetical protein LBG74_03155, partial [Spirochaetaceae bacterium]|nr:hypothetical protein [Spirochaetaceae bacterium]
MNFSKKTMAAAALAAAFALTGCGGKPAPAGRPAENSARSLLEFKDVGDFNSILKDYPNGVLANVNGDGLRTQIITFQFLDGN